MRKFDTKVQHLKYKVLREVARESWNGTLMEHVLDIPKNIVPGTEPTMRCCVYKERAILAERVRMAMVLAQDTPIVLLDEPTSFMDVAACFDMVRLIRQVRQRGKTVVAVIHDLNLALSVADQVFVMERGRLAAQGEPTDGCVRTAIEQSFGVRLEHVRTGCGTAWVPFESRE